MEEIMKKDDCVGDNKKTKRLDLINALKQVMPGVEEKTIGFDVANAVMFDGELVKTFNDSISVSYPFKTDIECLVKAKELFVVLNKIDSENIRMVLLDNNKLQISGGRTTLKMTTLDPSKFVSLVDNLLLQNSEWVELPDEFCEGLRLCNAFSCSDSARPSLSGVFVVGDGLAASDSIKAAFYHLDTNVGEPFMVPGRVVNDLVKIGKLDEFSVSGGWVHFRNDKNACFSFRRVNIDFPIEQIKGYLDFEGLDEEHQFPEELFKSIERASVFSYSNDAGSEYVEIFVDKRGNMIVSGGKQFGQIKEKIAKGDWSFPKESRITVNPKIFMDMISMNRKFYLKNKLILMRTGKLDSVSALLVSEK